MHRRGDIGGAQQGAGADGDLRQLAAIAAIAAVAAGVRKVTSMTAQPAFVQRARQAEPHPAPVRSSEPG